MAWSKRQKMIESLKLRVSQLEQHLGTPDRFRIESVTAAIDDLKGQASALPMTKAWDEIVEKYRRFKLLLETTNVRRQLGISNVKAVTILNSRVFLSDSHKLLERIQSLRHHAAFEPLHDLADKRKRLRTLELSAVTLATLTAQKREKVDALLREYNETLLQVSRLLVGD